MGIKKRVKRRHRRQTKMRRTSHGKFKVGHKLLGGRTGSVHYKKLRSRQSPDS